MKKLIISQRFEKIGDHNELRDNLDVRLSKFIFELNYLPILLPGNLEKMNKYLNFLSPEGIILSGGGDPFKKDKRYLIEKQLIDIAIKKKIPLLGICRGAQRINIHFKGKLKKIQNHVRKKHLLIGPSITSKIKVNSFHDFGFDEDMLGKKLKILAQTKDGIIKFFKHENNFIKGIMWHPERNKKIMPIDKKIFKGLFK